jgi:ferrous iron transport protein B
MKNNHGKKPEADPVSEMAREGVTDHAIQVALAGNPNSGKTSLFNALTGGRAKTGNYAGVTVEKKEGRFRTAAGRDVRIVDLPGLYSLSAASPEEVVAQQVLLGLREDTPKPDVAIVVVDATNLERNIYLVLQIAETGIPTIVALNMSDIARKRGILIDRRELSHELGLTVIETVAVNGKGVAELKELLDHLYTIGVPPRRWQMHHETEHVISEVAQELLKAGLAVRSTADWLARRALFSDSLSLMPLNGDLGGLRRHIQTHRAAIRSSDDDLLDEEVTSRYAWIRKVCERTIRKPGAERRSGSELIDRIALHPVAGYLIFLIMLALAFQAIFSWAEWPTHAIQAGVAELGDSISSSMPPGELRNLLVNGVLAGVGNVLAFLPQIVLLFFFISLLEESGYMARAAFLMDRIMGRVGLSGHSFIPLLGSFACTVPGIIATRTIRDPRNRLVTTLLAPLMPCSARLPVYTLLIAAFFPEHILFGFVSVRGLILLTLYFGGVLSALVVAWALKHTLLKEERTSLLLEMPSYKVPSIKNVGLAIWESGWSFIKRAGSIILVVTIIFWFLISHPINDQLASNLRHTGVGEAEVQRELVRASYLGMFGQAIEPLIRPLGFDWKIGVGLTSAMAAREVIIGTLAIIYNTEASGERELNLKAAMLADVNPATGQRVWTPLIAASLLAFFVFACLCSSTLVTVYTETHSLRWTLFVLAYTFALAYLTSLLVYQGGLALGLR